MKQLACSAPSCNLRVSNDIYSGFNGFAVEYY